MDTVGHSYNVNSVSQLGEERRWRISQRKIPFTGCGVTGKVVTWYQSVHSQSSLAQFLVAQLYIHSSLLFPARNEIRKKGKENDFPAAPHKQVLKVQLVRDNTRRATHSMFPHALQYRQTDRNMGRTTWILTSLKEWHTSNRLLQIANGKQDTQQIIYSHYAPSCDSHSNSPSWLTSSFGLLSKAIFSFRPELPYPCICNLALSLFFCFWCWGCPHTCLACTPLLSYTPSHMAFPSLIL